MMNPVILYPIIFGWLAIREFKMQGVKASTLLLTLYFACSLSTMFFVGRLNSAQINMITIDKVCYHLIILLLIIVPSLKLFRMDASQFKPIPIEMLKWVSSSLIVVSLVTMYISFGEIYTKLSIFQFEMGAIRNEYYSGNLDIYSGGFDFKGVFGVFSIFALPALFSFCYYDVKKYKIYKILLFLSSINIIVQNLRAMSRDGFLIWVLVFGLCFLLFKPILNKSQRKLWSIVIVVACVLVAFFFLWITVSRAALSSSTSDYSDSTYFFFDYMGQSFINFSIGLVNPVFVRNTFKTFASNICYGSDPLIVISFCVALFVVLTVFGKKKIHNFSDINILAILYYYIGFGVLYQHWFFSNRAYILSMILYVVLTIILNKFFNKTKFKIEI